MQRWLVAANAATLECIDLGHCCLRDAGLGPLFEALPANTHLRELDIVDNATSEALARDVLLPALRANSSLRMLHANSCVREPGLAEAIALVAARRNTSGAA
jgi:hypothetical protein